MNAVCCHPDGCPRPRETADGWCHMHHQRIVSHGDPGQAEPLLHRPRTQPEECWAPLGDHEGGGPCGRATVAHGLCRRHARRLQRNGHLAVKRRMVPRT